MKSKKLLGKAAVAALMLIMLAAIYIVIPVIVSSLFSLAK
jgi:uncharacterized protein YqhQ